MRFIVTAAFAFMLVRATFANTAAWRHEQPIVSAAVHQENAKKPLTAQRVPT